MPPKMQPKAQFPLSPAQVQAVEELLPTLRSLNDDWQPYILKLQPFMKEKPAVAFVDRMCWEYNMPVKRTIIARLEYLMASIIQSNASPEQVIEHCMAALGDKGTHLNEQFSSQFRESATQMLQLREVWQGSDDEHDDAQHPMADSDDNDDASVYQCGHCKAVIAPNAKYCIKCGCEVQDMDTASDASDDSNEQPKTSTKGKAKKCTHCHSAIDIADYCCTKCGTVNKGKQPTILTSYERHIPAIYLYDQMCQMPPEGACQHVTLLLLWPPATPTQISASSYCPICL